MNRNRPFWGSLGHACVIGMLLCASGVARAQSTSEPASTSFQPVLTSERSLYSPNRPILLGFSLRNTTDVVADLVLPSAESDGSIGLPLDVVFGTADSPALFMTREGDKPTPVMPPAAASGGEMESTIRLAPRGFLGREIDLRDYVPAIRYSGMYTIEWRPLGGRSGSASVKFRVEERKDVIIVTDKGNITFTLDYENAPRNVENFLDLVREGFYDGKTFHRLYPGYLIQGGCSKGDGNGIRPDGKLIPAEFHDAPFEIGTVAMARKPSDPNSASCQFFIALARLPELDGQYTVIGQIEDDESLRTLHQLAQAPLERDSNKPREPIVIRWIKLINPDRSVVTRFDLTPTRTGLEDSDATTAGDNKHDAP